MRMASGLISNLLATVRKLKNQLEKIMKKQLLTLFIALILTGCTPTAQSQKDTVAVPVQIVIRSGITQCPECGGDGSITVENESIHCPLCDGFGKLNLVSPGVLENYSAEFIRGYKACESGVSFSKAPLLQIRAKEWKAGWLEAHHGKI